MKKVLFIGFALLMCCKKTEVSKQLQLEQNKAHTPVSLLPEPDHIIFVWFENKGFNSIIGNKDAPYINSLLAQGTLFTNCYALTHPSYPNYIAFFAGTTNGVRNDNCITDSTWKIPNLYTQLKKAGKTFTWYSEDLPETGSTICKYGNYVEKHNPTTLFANVPRKANKKLSDFPVNYSKLSNVVCITPNLKNDMHDGTVKMADTWLQTNFSRLIKWCTKNNSIFVIYYDESERKSDNRIPVIAIGEKVKANFVVNTRYDHYSWTRTVCSMFYAPKFWNDSIMSRKDIAGLWLP